MKMYVAVVRLNGNLKIVKDEYTSKDSFKRDLRNNGYRVLKAFTVEEAEYLVNADWYDIMKEYKVDSRLNASIEFLKENYGCISKEDFLQMVSDAQGIDDISSLREMLEGEEYRVYSKLACSQALSEREIELGIEL